MWKEIQKKNSIWYFDATGSCHKDIPNQKKPFLYSIVMHDVAKKQVITFADFITTANDATSISKYLSILIDRLEKSSKQNLKPNIVVTDLSWALINAVMISFNKCKPCNYLIWCYKILIEKNYDINLLNAMPVRAYLCNSHFLKNIIKKLKSISEKNCSKLVRKTFLFFLTLVQNSNYVEIIEDYLKHIYNIFNNRFLDDSVLESLNYLNDQLNLRKLSNVNVEFERDPQQQERDKQFSEIHGKDIFIGNNYDTNIRDKSPFKKYFEDKITMFKSNLEKRNEVNKKNKNLNEYFCPEVFMILNDELSIIPMWTGVMLIGMKIEYDCKTRLTNDFTPPRIFSDCNKF
jgi:hypothetical protein